MKRSICDGYQMQLSEHHKPSFTKDFPVTLSCIQTEAGFKGTPKILKQNTFKTDGNTVTWIFLIRANLTATNLQLNV